MSFKVEPRMMIRIKLNPLTPVLAITGRDELWPFSSQPSRRSITAAKRKENNKKGKGEKNSKN